MNSPRVVPSSVGDVSVTVTGGGEAEAETEAGEVLSFSSLIAVITPYVGSVSQTTITIGNPIQYLLL